MLAFLPACRIRLTPATRAMLTVLEEWSFRFPGGVVVITHGTDGKHSVNSKHYTGNALDVRAKTLSLAAALDLKETLQEFLDSHFRAGNIPVPFTVLLEDPGGPNSHFHLQVKKGYVYPDGLAPRAIVPHGVVKKTKAARPRKVPL